MNIDLKNSLVMALVGAAITSAGFLAKDHFDAENKKEKFVFEGIGVSTLLIQIRRI